MVSADQTLSSIIIIGVAVCVAGIAVIGYAGALKGKNMSEEARKAAVAEFAFVITSYSIHYTKLYDGEIIRKKLETVPGNYGLFYDNVYAAITTGAELLVKPEESRDCLRILEACLLSNQEQRTIHL